MFPCWKVSRPDEEPGAWKGSGSPEITGLGSRGSWDLALLPYVVLIQPLGGGGGDGGGTHVCKCACVSVARGGGWS